MPIQLICSDIDGTLLNKDRQLAEATIAQVRRLAHIPFILISSRMPQAMTHLQDELGITHLPLIAYNGGLLIAGTTVINSTEIPIKTVEQLYCKIQDSELHYSLYHADEWYVPEMDFWANREANNTKVSPVVQAVSTTISNWKKTAKGAHKIMVMGAPEQIDALVAFIELHFNTELVGYRSKDTYLEIAPISISKKTAIQTLLKSHYSEIKMTEVLAFGDNYNDIEMLEAVGTGVAVANANKTVLAVADHITETNKDNGVANYLKNIVI